MKNPSENKQIIPIIDEQKKKLSKLETLFNHRIKRIKDLKENINLASKQIQSYHQESTIKIFPINQKIVTKEVVLVNLLVEIFDENVLTEKKQIRKFKELLLFFIEDLIFEKEQEGLEKIYQRFAGKTIQESRNESKEAAEREGKQKLIQMINALGLELNEEEKEKLLQKESDIDFMNSIKERLYQVHSKKNSSSSFEKAGYRKSKKRLQKEEKKNEKLENISTTVKQVYKELMKELHPDKEIDEIKRLEKTTLVQYITEAYRNDDLFTLLSIKFTSLEGADNTNLSDEKVEYFNKMLIKQIQDLEEQKRQMGLRANIHPVLVNFLGKTEFYNFSKRIIEQTQREVEKKLLDIDIQLEKVEAKDKKYIKRFINEQYELLIEDKFEGY
jgi:hypothetical protein